MSAVLLPALVEVSDKLPTLLEMWIVNGCIAVLLLGLSLPHRALALLLLVPALFWGYGGWTEAYGDGAVLGPFRDAVSERAGADLPPAGVRLVVLARIRSRNPDRPR